MQPWVAEGGSLPVLCGVFVPCDCSVLQSVGSAVQLGWLRVVCCLCCMLFALSTVQALELDEHYDNTDDMYCDIADRLEAVEAAAPAASLAGHLGSLTIKKDGKLKSGGGKVGTHSC